MGPFDECGRGGDRHWDSYQSNMGREDAVAARRIRDGTEAGFRVELELYKADYERGGGEGFL